MKLVDIVNAETYLYCRVVAALADRYSAGDYVRNFSYDGDSDIKWYSQEDALDYFTPKFNNQKGNSMRWNYVPLIKITKSEIGYIEAYKVDPETKEIDLDASVDLMGYVLRDVVDEYMNYADQEEDDADEAVQLIADNFIKLDEIYVDSQILEYEYIPYKDSLDVQDLLKQIQDAKDKDNMELLRQRALKGHATRRRNKKIALEIAKRDAIYAALMISELSPLRKKKVAKKKVIKRVKK